MKLRLASPCPDRSCCQGQVTVPFRRPRLLLLAVSALVALSPNVCEVFLLGRAATPRRSRGATTLHVRERVTAPTRGLQNYETKRNFKTDLQKAWNLEDGPLTPDSYHRTVKPEETTEEVEQRDYLAKLHFCLIDREGHQKEKPEVERARAVIQEMKAKDVPIELQHWRALIRVMSAAKMWQEIEQVWEDMSTAKKPVRPDSECFCLALDAAIGEGIEPPPPTLHGEHILEQVKRRGVLPPLDMFMKVMRAHLDAGRQEEAEAVYDQASANEMLANIWTSAGNVLDVMDFDLETSKVVLYFALRDMAIRSLGRLAGRKGFKVITRLESFRTTDPDTNREKEYLRIMADLGLKVRKDKQVPGRIDVKHNQLRILGMRLKGASQEEIDKEISRLEKRKRARQR